jgi:hypothetical protein
LRRSAAISENWSFWSQSTTSIAFAATQAAYSSPGMSAAEAWVTLGWSHTGSATGSFRARSPLPCLASTNVSCPS